GLTGLDEVVDHLRPLLSTFRDESGRELFDLPDASRPDPATPATVRFLPEFDNVLLSYADRTRIISDDDRKRIHTANGLVPGTVLVDGFVHGKWKIDRGNGAAKLVVEPFRKLSKKDASAIVEEGLRLLSFAGGEETRDVQLIATAA
ncbi:MAG: DNA glycosylase AlkZ-like family protein, partial [Acidimicrobiales bacterium]